MRHHEPFDLTPHMVTADAAALRMAGYRLAMAYVDIAVQEFRRRRGVDTHQLSLAVSDARRAYKRGIGQPKQAGAFPIGHVGELCPSPAALCNGGPMRPKAALTCGLWWLACEIELSSAIVRDIDQPDRRSVRWNLPASKSDPMGL